MGQMGADDFTAEDFLDVVYRDVYRSACEGVVHQLERPSGRNPDSRDLRLHRWYSELADEDRQFVQEALADAADAAVFGMLCLFDNVRPVTDGFKTELRLYVETEGRISPLPMRPGEELHAGFRYLVDNRDRFFI